MRNRKRLAAGLIMALVLTSPAAWASRGSSFPSGAGPRQEKTPAERATDCYNSGLKSRDRAVQHLKEAAEASDEKGRGQPESKARKEFEKAIDKFQEATKLNPLFHQAFSDLGFSLRKIGDYAGALEAYGRALSLAPTYAPAIEYRAEAYLALNRLEEAKQAYLQLFPADRSHADELLEAMRQWVGRRRSDPGDLTPEAVQGFASWIEERDQLAKQTPSVSELQKRKW